MSASEMPSQKVSTLLLTKALSSAFLFVGVGAFVLASMASAFVASSLGIGAIGIFLRTYTAVEVSAVPLLLIVALLAAALNTGRKDSKGFKQNFGTMTESTLSSLFCAPLVAALVIYLVLSR
jgi:hypothetical protein